MITRVFTYLGKRRYRRRRVSQKDFGDAWPFSVEAGELGCYLTPRGAREVVLKANGRTYALNGTARASDRYEDIQDAEIWMEDPEWPGLKMSLGPLLRLARPLSAGMETRPTF